jgi:hypothetical protein
MEYWIGAIMLIEINTARIARIEFYDWDVSHFTQTTQL